MNSKFKKMTAIAVAIISTLCVSLCCFGCSDDTAKTLDNFNLRLNAINSQLAEAKEEIDSLKTQVAILNGTVLNPKTLYAMGETVTFVSDGFKLFDFKITDAWKTDKLFTFVTYEFNNYNISTNGKKLSDFIKFRLYNVGGDTYATPIDAISFPPDYGYGFTSGTMKYLLSGEGTTTMRLSFDYGTSYLPIADMQVTLQLRETT